MESITLKEIAGYFANNIQMLVVNEDDMRFGNKVVLQGISDNRYQTNWGGFYFNELKPILQNLSMLTQEIEHNGEKIIPIEELAKNFPHFDFQFTDDFELLLQLKPNVQFPNHYFMAEDVNVINQMLYEWHFDVHGLIKRGLAIDKSKI